MKLTEGWGEAKNDSKGEDDGFKMEEGEREGRGKYLYNIFSSFSLPLPSSPSPFSTCFQNGGLSDR